MKTLSSATRLIFLLTPIFALASACSANAAPIFSSSMAASADTDVLDSGTTALAFSFYDQIHSTTSLVNGVTFSGSFDNATSGVDFSYDSAHLGAGDGNGTTLTASSPGVSQNYVNILTNLKYNNNASSSLTFTGLTAGDNYQLQVWGGGGVSDYETLADTVGGSGNLYYGSGYNAGDTGYIIETFKAKSGTETIDLNQAAPGHYIVFNAVDLRALGVPEPSTWAMMLGGLALLGLLAHRKNASTKN